MTPMEDLLRRVRSELGDLETTFQETLIATGLDNRYTVNHAPLNAASVIVLVDGVDITEAAPGESVAIEETTGTLIFDFIPEKGAVIVASGLAYRFFTNAELTEICTDAVEMHANHRTDVRGRPIGVNNIPSIEEYPLTLLATINALYVLATDASFDIDIQAPDGLMIPRSQRYRQLMELIEQLKGRYAELSSLLGIGLYAIEIFTLQRVSKRTNRYIPVYRPQEIDDRSKPERLYFPMPTYGADIADDGIPALDLTINQGDTFSQLVTIPSTIVPPDGSIFKAQIRGYAGSPVIAAEFTIVCLPDVSGVVISLTSEQTRNLPRNSVWDLQYSYPLPPHDFYNDDFSTDFDVDYPDLKVECTATAAHTPSSDWPWPEGPLIREDGAYFVKTIFRGRVFSPREVTSDYTPSNPTVAGTTTMIYPPTNQGGFPPQSIWSTPS